MLVRAYVHLTNEGEGEGSTFFTTAARSDVLWSHNMHKAINLYLHTCMKKANAIHFGVGKKKSTVKGQ